MLTQRSRQPARATGKHWLATLLLVPLMLAASLVFAQSRDTIMVPMRDGINLATNIYLPADEGP